MPDNASQPPRVHCPFYERGLLLIMDPAVLIPIGDRACALVTEASIACVFEAVTEPAAFPANVTDWRRCPRNPAVNGSAQQTTEPAP
jgi:hypothetical protein